MGTKNYNCYAQVDWFANVYLRLLLSKNASRINCFKFCLGAWVNTFQVKEWGMLFWECWWWICGFHRSGMIFYSSSLTRGNLPKSLHCFNFKHWLHWSLCYQIRFTEVHRPKYCIADNNLVTMHFNSAIDHDGSKSKNTSER